ncbi:MAG: hypothetical protein IKB51_04565 [Clostridia bacterium]|nr:hypothetical protein [Clostridia bacterium]
MKDSVKSLYCKITAIVLAVIMVILLVACFLPLVKVRTAGRPIDPIFSTGRYTAGKTIPEADLGIGSAISFLGDLRMANLVISVQNNDKRIAQEEEQILEYQVKELEDGRLDGDYDTSITSCRNRIIELQADTAEHLAEFTPEELEELQTVLLNDESFLESLGVYYGFLALFDDSQYTDSYPSYTENSIHMIIFLFGIICFVIAVIALIVYLVASVINVIIKGIYFGVRVMNADDKVLDRLFPKMLPGIAGMLFILMLVLVVFNGYGVTFGSGLITMLVCYVIVNVIRGVSKIILSDTIAWGEVVKFVISLIAVVLIFAAIVSFLNVAIFATTMEDGPAYMAKQYEVTYKAEYDAKMAECPCAECTNSTDPDDWKTVFSDHANQIKTATSYAESAAKKAANDGFKKNALIALLYDVVTLFILGISFICFVERLGAKTYKNKYSTEVKGYGPMVAVGILLIVCFLVPNFLFTVSTVEDRTKAYEEGSIKLLLDDYAIDETPDNIKYKALVEVRDGMEDKIAELDENATDYESTKLHADRALALVNGRIDMLETSQSSSLVAGVIWSVLITATSFAYIFAVKPLEAILNKVFGKKSDASVE